MKKIKINDNSYFLPEYKAIIVYTDSEKSNDCELIDKINFLYHENKNKVLNRDIKNIIPLHLDIFPTYKCNLRCKYCYSGTGDYIPRSLFPAQINGLYKGLIRTIKMKKMIKNDDSKETVEIFFAGGGEPTYEWDILTYSVNEANRLSSINDFIVNFGIVTNGMVSDPKKIDYLCEKFKYIQVSTDGLEIVQDYHRPTSENQKSSSIVYNFINKCLEKNKKVGLRLTVSNYSVEYLTKSIEFFAKNFKGLSHIQVEPLSMNQKSEKNNLQAPDPNQFIVSYFESLKISKKYNIGVISSVANIFSIRDNDTFCDAITGGTVILNPDGYLSRCYEASTDIKDMSHAFFVGQINELGEIHWNNQNNNFVCSKKISNCEKCIAWEFCKGGCVAMMVRNGFNRAYHCSIVKGIFKLILNEISINEDENILINIHKIEKPIENVSKIIYWKEEENVSKLVLPKL